MFNYQIIIEYDGVNFIGWQKQKNGLSVQQKIEKILTKILKKKNYNLWLWQDRLRRSRRISISSF